MRRSDACECQNGPEVEHIQSRFFGFGREQISGSEVATIDEIGEAIGV